MGSGKTTMLRILKENQQNSSFKFFDLDEELYFFCKPDISRRKVIYKQSLLKELDWTFFKQKEAELLQKYIKDFEEDKIIALGGESLSLNIEIPAQLFSDKRNVLVWLDVPFLECMFRVEKRMGKKILKEVEGFFPNLYSKWCENYRKAPTRLTCDDVNDIKCLKSFLRKIVI